STEGDLHFFRPVFLTSHRAVREDGPRSRALHTYCPGERGKLRWLGTSRVQAQLAERLLSGLWRQPRSLSRARLHAYESSVRSASHVASVLPQDLLCFSEMS